MDQFLMIGIIFVIFYFFMIRPQMKKSKELKAFREGLKKGDEVMTSGGIHGIATEIDEATIVMALESGAKMRVEKAALVKDYIPNLK